MRAPDCDKFIKAMEKEIENFGKRKFWELTPCSGGPRKHKVIPSVWSFKRKRRVDTGKVYQYKACCTVGGQGQKKGVNFRELYLPVVNWLSICLCLALALKFGWHTRQLDLFWPTHKPRQNAICMLKPKSFPT